MARGTRQPYKNTTALVRIAHGRDRSGSGGTDQPALQVLGSCVDLLKQWQDHLPIAYHGLMKKEYGMKILDRIHVAAIAVWK
jgi:hypothetical protein